MISSSLQPERLPDEDCEGLTKVNHRKCRHSSRVKEAETL
mgnify:CR=1 FL=1